MTYQCRTMQNGRDTKKKMHDMDKGHIADNGYSSNFPIWELKEHQCPL